MRPQYYLVVVLVPLEPRLLAALVVVVSTVRLLAVWGGGTCKARRFVFIFFHNHGERP